MGTDELAERPAVDADRIRCGSLDELAGDDLHIHVGGRLPQEQPMIRAVTTHAWSPFDDQYGHCYPSAETQ